MPITVSTKINAPEELIWSCMTTPEHITQWNFASPEWCCPNASCDVQPGGRFDFRMEATDGSMGFNFTGTYVDVQPCELLSYNLDDERFVQVNMERKDGAVETTQKFDPEDMNPEDFQRAGWQAILDNFKLYVENLNAAS